MIDCVAISGSQSVSSSPQILTSRSLSLVVMQLKWQSASAFLDSSLSSSLVFRSLYTIFKIPFSESFHSYTFCIYTSVEYCVIPKIVTMFTLFRHTPIIFPCQLLCNSVHLDLLPVVALQVYAVDCFDLLPLLRLYIFTTKTSPSSDVAQYAFPILPDAKLSWIENTSNSYIFLIF